MNKYNNIQWVVQQNLNFSKDVERISAACDKFGITFQTIEAIPFSSELPNFNRSRKTILYGAVTLANLFYIDKKLDVEIGYNPAEFSMSNYISKWKNYMLNSSAKKTNFKELVEGDFDPEEEFFIRPDDDNKLFAGTVMKFKDIKDWENKIKLLGFDYSTPIIISKPYNIAFEWRLWIVKGKVITASKYREYFKLKKEPGCPEEVIKFAENRCKEYTPHDVFVMDICLCGDSYYIVECGSFNSAGFYEANIEIIVKEISDYYVELK